LERRSFWALFALIPAGLIVGLFVLRTSLEDRTLQRELPGYADYAARTRWKLVPIFICLEMRKSRMGSAGVIQWGPIRE